MGGIKGGGGARAMFTASGRWEGRTDPWIASKII